MKIILDLHYHFFHSSGPGGISSLLFFAALAVSKESLLPLIRKSWEFEMLTSEWKNGTIVMIPTWRGLLDVVIFL